MFCLRPLEQKDFQTVACWIDNYKLIELLGVPTRYLNLDYKANWLESYVYNCGNALRFVITTEDKDDTILGLVSLSNIDYFNQSAELNIIIDCKEKQENNVEAYAISEMLKYAFYNMDLQRVEIILNENDVKSKKINEKYGFVYEGCKRKSIYVNGTFENLYIYAILKQEYLVDNILSNVVNYCIDEVKSISELKYIIQKCDSAFTEPIHTIPAYNILVDKLSKNAKILVAYNKEILGYNAFYCNNSATKTAYISLIAVNRAKQNKHIGKTLLNCCENICISYGMLYLDLEVRKNNYKARRFYEKHKFYIIEDRESSYIMQKKLF